MKFEEKKMQHDFSKMRGGFKGQLEVGTFSKIPPFWCGHPSLRMDLMDLIGHNSEGSRRCNLRLTCCERVLVTHV